MTIPKGYFDYIDFAVPQEIALPPILADRSHQICVLAVNDKKKNNVLGIFFLDPEDIDDFGMPQKFQDFLPNFVPPLVMDDGIEVVKVLCPHFFAHFENNSEARKLLLIEKEKKLIDRGELKPTLQ